MKQAKDNKAVPEIVIPKGYSIDNKAVPEIVIPKGYSIDEMLDLDDGDLWDEKPIGTEEVKIHFER